MTPEHDLAVTRVIEELAATADPSPDLHAARLELRRRTRRVVVVRRFVRVAVVAAAVVLAIALVRTMPEPQSAPLPAKQLPSGLPVGTLEGLVPIEGPGGSAGDRTLRLVVRADGTGSYYQQRGDLQDLWPVRYLGDRPGRVVLRGRGWSCGTDENELTVSFIVHPDSITITDAVIGQCSAFADADNVDYGGVILRLH